MQKGALEPQSEVVLNADMDYIVPASPKKKAKERLSPYRAVKTRPPELGSFINVVPVQSPVGYECATQPPEKPLEITLKILHDSADRSVILMAGSVKD